MWGLLGASSRRIVAMGYWLLAALEMARIDDDVTIDSRDEQFLYLIETAKYHFDALRNILNEIKRLYIS